MPKIRIKLNFDGIIVEIDDIDYNGEIFAFLDELTDYLVKNQGKINSFEIKSQSSEFIGLSPNKKLVNSSETQDNLYNTKIKKLAKDSKIVPERLELIFDFGTDDDLPPILISLNKSTRTENQRIAIILLLYVNKVINGEDKISSHSITPLLVKSNIDPTASSKAFRGENSKYVKIEGKLYRITPQGILEAKRVLNELNNSIGELS